MENENLSFDDLFAPEGSPRWNEMVSNVIDEVTAQQARELEQKRQFYSLARPTLIAAAAVLLISWGLALIGLQSSPHTDYSEEEIATAQQLIALADAAESPSTEQLLHLLGGTNGNQ
jgi:hypothetical protein